jgi:sister-chromatid-cohesion protein PDS5
MKQALWFVLEPLITKNENYSYMFYQDMIQKMKNCTDALNPDDDLSNKKIYAVCDLALGIVHSRSV